MLYIMYFYELNGKFFVCMSACKDAYITIKRRLLLARLMAIYSIWILKLLNHISVNYKIYKHWLVSAILAHDTNLLIK